MQQNASSSPIYSFLKGKGLSDAAIAGVMGNLQVESGFSPTAYNANEGAIGIAQWEGGRRTALQAYASAHGGKETDLNMQLGYMWQELTTSESGALAQLRGATSASQAATIWDSQYERSAGTTRGARISNANTLLSNGFTYSASAGGGAVPDVTGTAPGGSTKLAKADYTTALGSLSGLLTSIPELKGLLDKAIASNEPVNDFVNSVQNSQYYKTHGDAVRSYAALQVSDPAEAAQQQTNFIRQINDQANQLGIKLTTKQLNAIVSAGLWHGLTGDTAWLTQQIVGDADYSKATSTAGMQGQVAATVQQLQTLSASYGWKWTPAQLGTVALSILGGKTTIDTYKQQLITAAKSMFPGLTSQLDAGLTVMDAAQPYMQSMSNLLEIDPAKIDLNTPLVRRALQGTAPTMANAGVAPTPGTPAPKTTSPVLQPLWQFENQVRQDPRWGFTDNAHASMATQTMQVGRDFGFET